MPGAIFGSHRTPQYYSPMFKEGIIYLITNTVNGKKYVGKTVTTLKKRWFGHCSAAKRGCNTALYHAIRKYGRDAFTVEVVAKSLEPFLNDLECMFIKLHCSRAERWGYNMTDGGEGASGHILTAEHRAKIGAAHKGMKRSEETRRKMSDARKGKNFPSPTEETRRKMSEARLGKKLPPLSKEHRDRLRVVNLGKRGHIPPKSACEHCGLLIGHGALKRWHGENCKARFLPVTLSTPHLALAA